VIEVNDNPNVEHGVEDLVLKDGLYDRIMQSFLRRLEAAAGLAHRS
jgi:glutathione synthase/RimK-type ligase-like ATP-grasp enzyme